MNIRGVTISVIGLASKAARSELPAWPEHREQKELGRASLVPDSSQRET